MGHDACGVGFIADTRRQPSHDTIRLGLSALQRLTHRGAPAALGAVDGCGVMTAIPWALLPAGQALGMVFGRQTNCRSRLRRARSRARADSCRR